MRRRGVLWFAGCAALAGTVAVAAAARDHRVLHARPTRQGRAAAGGAAVVPSPAPPVLLGDARVRVLVVYPACGVRREGSGPLPVGLVGRTRAQVASAVAPDLVSEFSPVLLVLERRFPGCPGDTVTLVERGGKVVELAGPPGDTGAVLLQTDIPVRGLSPKDAARVEAGLAVPAGRAEAELARLAREARGQPPAGPSIPPARSSAGSAPD